MAVELQPSVTILPAKPEDVLELSSAIRHADRLEGEALGVDSVEEELLRALACSTHAWTGRVNGEIVCMFGAAPKSTLMQSGCPWMIGAVCLERYQRPFLRYSRPYVAEMLGYYRTLTNVVDARNQKALHWLRWLGAEFTTTEYIGRKRLAFHHFVLRRED